MTGKFHAFSTFSMRDFRKWIHLADSILVKNSLAGTTKRRPYTAMGPCCGYISSSYNKGNVCP